jgi:hypothetical protein
MRIEKENVCWGAGTRAARRWQVWFCIREKLSGHASDIMVDWGVMKVTEKSGPQGNDGFPCITRKVNKDALELYLKAKYGDKIRKPRDRAKSLLSREFCDYMRENMWTNLHDTRIYYWRRKK